MLLWVESHTSAAISKEFEKVIEEIPGLLPDAVRVAAHSKHQNINAKIFSDHQQSNLL